MPTSLMVNVQGLGGSELQFEMQPEDIVEILREKISTAWSLETYAFRLLAGSAFVEDDAEVQSLAPGDGVPLEVQLVKFDPLLGLGQFDPSAHRGIEVKPLDGKIPRTVLVKGRGGPDSNNVFLRHPIVEPCFVEFKVVRSRDEMSFGVTYEAENVEKLSDFRNLGEKSTWVYSKRKSMPVFQFAGSSHNPTGAGFAEGDTVAVYADPQERSVAFYKNGEHVGGNMPNFPLPAEEGRALRMYAMVDFQNDQVEIVRFGPGEPY